MGLRNRTQQPFWRTTPIRSSDPADLYRHGIESVGKRDGKAMMATGWALCQIGGLHENQATDFLTDGFRTWRDSPTYDPALAAAFLADLFGALCSLNPPAVPDDIWSAPPEAVMPGSIYYGTRCWAGTELLDLTTDPTMRAQYEPLVFRATTEAPHDFVPTRSLEFVKSYAAAHGLPEPWAIVLPSPRDEALNQTDGPAAHRSASSTPAAPSATSAPAAVDVHSKPGPDPRTVLEMPSVSERPVPVSIQPGPAMPRSPEDFTSPSSAPVPLNPPHLEAPASAGPSSATVESRRSSRVSGTDEEAGRPRPRPTPGPQASASAGTTVDPVHRLDAPPAPEPQVYAPQPVQQPAPQPPPYAQQPAPQPAAYAPQPAPQPTVYSPEPTPQAFVPQAPQAAPAESPTTADERLADLRQRLSGWLHETYRDVRQEPNGWLTIPDIGPTAIQVESTVIEDDHLKVEIFAPLVLEVPVSVALLRHVALQSGRFHFGSIVLDAGLDGTDERGLLQFSCSLLADDLGRDEFLTVVSLVATTAIEKAVEMRNAFGGQLYVDVAGG